MKKNKIQNFIVSQDYVPYDKLILCSNTILNVKYFIDDNKFYPILVGSGDTPRIWIFTKISKDEFLTVVEDNISKINQLKVDIFQKEKRILISLGNTGISTIVLEIFYNEEIPKILHFDLRNLGYEIYGDEKKLMVGKSNISGNTIQGIESIIVLK